MLKRENNQKIFYIENLGCSKNQVDAEIIIASLEKERWEYVDNSNKANLIIVNTCGFIKEAKTEAIDTIISFREMYPDKKILMAGCFAQRYGSSLLDKMPEIDGIFGNLNLQVVPGLAESVIMGKRTALLPVEGFSVHERKKLISFPGSAYVKISEGCNHRCAYCAIPIIRGNLRSKKLNDIITEIKKILDNGVIEINLIAQDLASFGVDKKDKSFLKLLNEISKLTGYFWIRLLYIHPDNFPMELLDIVTSEKRILPYFDLPFQHSASTILSRMGRNGSSSKYLNLITSIRNKIPEAVIRSTFLLGFPGETAVHRKELLDFQIKASLDWIGTFIYSREEDTKAWSMRGTLGHHLAQPIAARFKRKLELQQISITEKQMNRFVGSNMDVLIEEKVEAESMAIGRSYLHAPEVDGLVVVVSNKVTPGKIVRCKITKRNGFDLEAVPVDEL